MPDPLDNKTVALGVTGSIACYKSVDLASKLVQAGAAVDVIMTHEATNFVAPLTFNSITHRPVVSDMFDPQSELGMDHVAIAQRADIVIVAPVTAQTLAKIAWGLADDALTTTLLATQAPVILAPAMDAHMYENPATQQNVEKLKSWGYIVVGPAEGRLASGLTGRGRLLETHELLGHIRAVLGRDGDLAGRKVVVSAGGTREPLDPVRVISNRSTGKMGYAIAEAARDRGGDTVLVSAATSIPDPVRVRVLRVETAEEMRSAVLEECRDADALVMAAAVGDWRPVSVASQKIKKTGSDTWSVDLTKNPDIVAEVQRDGLVKVGFAAESEDLVSNAQEKLASKGLHLIAANDITSADSGFATDDNRVFLLDREGSVEELPLMPKYEVAHRILDRVVPLLA
ncbi:MAG: bifunctional phosphopantothenoylcysteine decarboxylase/phosphopantothenate--cysteine ligase CoaBC [Chloroflexi bacterium]|nr:bifunctional phosphopantothenoylcysteine decarboxylase/phosphopantothenate--cysteine ligase CoaBC [Chloroflexota bacterium]